MYVIKCFDGKYVTKEGSQKSYTSKLQEARTYPTSYSALADTCGNESIVSITNEMR